MIKYWIVIYLCIVHFYTQNDLFAQSNALANAGPIGKAMGETKLLHFGLESAYTNPANLALLDDSGVSAFYESRYIATGLNAIQVSGVYDMEVSGIALNAYQYSFSSYNQRLMSLSYGRRLSRKLSIGAQMKWYQFEIDEYGSSSTLGFDIGITHKITERFFAAAVISNPMDIEVTDDESLNQGIAIGFSYILNEKTSILIEFEKQENTDLAAKLGLSYYIVDRIRIMGGFNSIGNSASFGIGINATKKVQLNIGSAWHDTLGISGSGGFSFLF